MSSHDGPRFTTTRWSVVSRAAGSDQSAAEDALRVLCESYWVPLYAYVRRRGFDPDVARDVTQGFFARLLEKRDIGQASPDRGRFRAYLLGSIQNFLSNWKDSEEALRRGGGQTLLRLDFEGAEESFRLDPADPETPEKIFEREWARALLERVMDRLGAEYEKRGKQRLWQGVSPLLAGGGEQSYEELAQELGSTEGAVKVAVHRARARYRQLLRKEIAETLDDSDQVEDELRALFQALG